MDNFLSSLKLVHLPGPCFTKTWNDSLKDWFHDAYADRIFDSVFVCVCAATLSPCPGYPPNFTQCFRDACLRFGGKRLEHSLYPGWVAHCRHSLPAVLTLEFAKRPRASVPGVCVSKLFPSSALEIPCDDGNTGCGGHFWNLVYLVPEGLAVFYWTVWRGGVNSGNKQTSSPSLPG